MSDRRFENFSKRLNERPSEEPPAPGPEDHPAVPDVPEAPTEPDQSEEDEAMPNDTPVEQTEAYQAGFKAANDRMNTVFAHENTVGREAHATRLLGRASLSADEITAELAHFPKAEGLNADEAREAAEQGGRQQMQEVMEASGNADLGATKDADANSARARATARWDKANAKIQPARKEN